MTGRGYIHSIRWEKPRCAGIGKRPFTCPRHQQDILYMGSNRFHRSMDQGDNFETLSGDLTRGVRKGNVPFGSLTSIHESPLRFGRLAVGFR